MVCSRVNFPLLRIARAERDGTRAETRIRLSPKWTSPIKSVGASVQSTTGSRGVRIGSSNGSNAGQTTFRGKVELYWLPTPFACFPFTSPPVRHRVPPGSERALLALRCLLLSRNPIKAFIGTCPYLRNSFVWDMTLHHWVLRTLELLKMKPTRSFETSGTDYPVT